MVKLYLLFGFLLMQGSLLAQNPLPGWISSAGGTSSDGDTHLTFVIGGILGQTLACDQIRLHRETFITNDPPIITQLDDSVDPDSYLFFPNPVQDMVHLRSKELGRGTLHLYNTRGKIVYENKSVDFRSPINLSHLPPGMYQLKFYLDNTRENYSHKLIKQ